VLAVLLAVHALLVLVSIRFMLLTGRYLPWGLILAGLVIASAWQIWLGGDFVSDLTMLAVTALVVAGAAILGPPFAFGGSLLRRPPASDSQFRKLADGSLDVLTVLEWDGRIRYVSGSVESNLGYRSDELIGKNAFEFVHADDRRRLLRLFAKRTSISGAAPPVSYRFRHRDGSWRTLETIANNLMDDNQVRGIVLSSRDMTVRMRMEDQLRVRAKQQETVAEIGQFALTTDDVQSLYEKATDLVRDALGSSYCVVFDPQVGDDRLTVVASSGVPGETKERLFARRLQDLPIEAEFLPDVAPHPMFEDVPALQDLGVVCGAVVRVSTESGPAAYLASFCTRYREYTEQDLNFLQSTANILAVSAGRRWAEDALQTAERSVHTMLTSMPLIFWAWDKNGVFTLSQGQGLERLGLKPGQIVGQSVFDVYKGVPEILDHAKQALAGRSFSATVDLDETAWDVWYRPIRDEAGSVTGVLGVGLDVADRRRAEEGVRRIFQMSQELLCVGSLDGSLLSVNPAFTRTLGWSEEDLIGNSVLSFVHPDDRSNSAIELQRVADGHSTVRFENRCRCADGGYRWLSWMATPMLETGLVYASARDVTEAKMSQRALLASEEKFAKAFHSNPTLMAITRLDDGGYVEVNDSYLDALGYTREEILGKSTLELEIWADPFARDSIVEEIAEKGAVRHRLVEYAAKNGDLRLGLLSVELITLGGEQYALALVDDITSRKKAEEALLRSEAEFRHLVDHAIYGIYRSNEKGQLLSVNPALVEMLGYDSAEDLMAIDMARDVYVDESERKRLVDQYRERGIIRHLDVEWQRKDGAPITVRLSGRPVRDATTGELQFEMFVEDVTERRALEAQLQQAQKMEAIGQLTGGIAHDFNNILTAVLGNAEILAADLPPEFANLQAEVTDIRSAAQRGAAMIRKLMTFSRREALEMNAIDPDQLCRDTTSMLRRILPANITIDVQPGGIERAVIADRGAIEQVLVNLATNARDAMDRGGTLSVKTALTTIDVREAAQRGIEGVGEFVVISVGDTGTGMDAETLAHIFEPFYTTKPTGRGTGLGMAMVYGLVSRHGGFVKIESALGEGTTVHVFFPAVDAVVDKPQDQVATDLPRGSERVLLVEDEAALRRMGERILTRFGYSVVTAEDGQAAWDLLCAGANEIDLIVTDVIMPRLSGGELYERVRGTDCRTPFLFTTGYAASEIDGGSMQADGVPMLPKPWTADQLVRGVRGALDAQRS